MLLADDIFKALRTVLASDNLITHSRAEFGRQREECKKIAFYILHSAFCIKKPGRPRQMQSKLPLLPSGPRGVRKSTFHGPWLQECGAGSFRVQEESVKAAWPIL